MMALTRAEMFDLLADHVAMFEAWLDTGEFTWTSKPLGILFGYPGAGELEGEPIEILVPPERRVAHRQYRDEYAKNPTARLMGARLTLEGYRKDGSRFPIEISLIPRRVNKRWLVVGKVLDMTSRQ